MNDYHSVKPRLPIMSVAQGNCPHGDQYRMTLTLHGHGTSYICTRCYSAIQDWPQPTKDEYYEKYPELKPLPDYTTMKVTLDESDKKPKQ